MKFSFIAVTCGSAFQLIAFNGGIDTFVFLHKHDFRTIDDSQRGFFKETLLYVFDQTVHPRDCVEWRGFQTYRSVNVSMQTRS